MAVDIVCLSHLRWYFVYQRPQHLMSRFANYQRVFFIEEPVFDEGPTGLEINQVQRNVWRVAPHLPVGLGPVEKEAILRGLIDDFFPSQSIENYILWYYTPMALGFTRHLNPSLVVYDCMDDLSSFKDAPPVLKEMEAELFQLADLVFTGGLSLYEAKKGWHTNIHSFPSSIDFAHFSLAREAVAEPDDQVNIPAPRLGFFGVVDERMDLNLLATVADAHSEWQLVLVGPVVKIDPICLPRRDNIHYLGAKSYSELPYYLAGWDVALLPFALNEATRFISPTKTPEYLAGGKPVVSTPILDVVRPYGQKGLVSIAVTPQAFVCAIEEALFRKDHQAGWLQQVDEFLAANSWEDTWNRMNHLMQNTMASRVFLPVTQELELD